MSPLPRKGCEEGYTGGSFALFGESDERSVHSVRWPKEAVTPGDTNVGFTPAEEESAAALLERYRGRGEAEKDFGDWNQALALSLSSTPRTKTHYRGRVLHEDFTEPDSFAANEARLRLSLLAANLLHAGAALLERESTGRMSRVRFRQLVLKTAARVLLRGHRSIVVIEAARAPLWSRFVGEFDRLYPARGSPEPSALPTPA